MSVIRELLLSSLLSRINRLIIMVLISSFILTADLQLYQVNELYCYQELE